MSEKIAVKATIKDGNRAGITVTEVQSQHFVNDLWFKQYMSEHAAYIEAEQLGLAERRDTPQDISFNVRRTLKEIAFVDPDELIKAGFEQLRS